MEIPDPESGEVRLTANLAPGEKASGTLAAGSYLVRATCLEKATGTVSITAEPKQ